MIMSWINYARIEFSGFIVAVWGLREGMKILVAEDEYIGRTLLVEMLAPFGTCDIAENGVEALEMVKESLTGKPYDLVCLDIMMPKLDGQQVLQQIRELEAQMKIDNGIKVIMTTALDDSSNIMRAFTQGACEGYLTKPIDKIKLIEQIQELGLIA